MATTPTTFKDIRQAVLRRVQGDEEDTETTTLIDGVINERYLRLATDWKWRWLQAERDLRIPSKYTTGTLTATGDSRSLVGSSTVWVDAMEGRYIKIEGEQTVHRIIAVNSNTTIELAERIERATASSLTYILFQADFGLFPDLEQVDEIWHEHIISGRLVKPIGPREYSEQAARFPIAEGKARFYTRYGFKSYEAVPIGQFLMGYDFIGQTDQYKLSTWPRVPDEDYTIHIRYTKKITALNLDGDEPLMPKSDRWVLVYGALADFYDSRGNETSSRYWNTEFNRAMKKMKADIDDSDDRAKLTIANTWGRRRQISTQEYDLGDFFDIWERRY